MRSTRRVALAMLAALPLAATGAGAVTAAPIGGSAVSKIEAGQPLINVGRRGGGGHGHGGMGHGGHGHHGGGGHWHGGGGHWHGGHHHHNHLYFRRGFYPGWYGVPYYYDYGPSYYDYYDDDDDAVVYSDSGDAVARCEARYRSFDRRSGTFLSTNGTRKLCPYLR